jgi:hypothetical protein
MAPSHHTVRSGGYDFTFCKRLFAVAGFAVALFAMQTLSAEAQGNRPQRQGQPPAQQKPAEPEPMEIEQIALTASQIDGFIATQKEITPVTARLKGNAQPTKQMMTQMDDIAKKHGFKDLDEFGDVGANIGMVFGGVDPLSKKYDPEALIKREIAAVTADQKIPAAQKKRILADLQQASTSVPALKFPGNAELVAQNYDRLKPVMMDEQPPPQQPQQGQGQPRQPPRR